MAVNFRNDLKILVSFSIIRSSLISRSSGETRKPQSLLSQLLGNCLNCPELLTF